DASLYATYVSRYKSARFVPPALGLQSLGDFANLNARIGYGFGERRQYRVYVAAENLLDDEYSTVAGYPDWGFRASAGIHFTF
ncbi:MAG: TonB-dependent receptor, partial [Planctomycetes bacterium]|nr:TonB-dependent receptor [Planctomycetota bacterium]